MRRHPDLVRRTFTLCFPPQVEDRHPDFGGLGRGLVFLFHQAAAVSIGRRNVHPLRLRQPSLNPADNNSQVTSMIDIGQNVMNSEMAHPHQLRPRGAGGHQFRAGKNSRQDWAVARIPPPRPWHRKALKVVAPRDSSVISITFRMPDPELVRPVLAELIYRLSGQARPGPQGHRHVRRHAGRPDLAIAFADPADRG